MSANSACVPSAAPSLRGQAEHCRDAADESLERVVRELRATLSISPGEDIRTSRVLEIVPHLLRLALVVDAVAWGVWKQKLAPASGSSLRPGAPLQRVLREHLTSDGAARPIEPELSRLRELVRAVLSGAAQCGGEVACRVMRGLSPSDIEAEAGGGGLRARDADYWRVFKDRASRLDGAAMEREVTGVVARFVDKWMRHAEASSRTS